MPKFEITSPDGTKYQVEGPEGSTQDQALEKVMQQHMETPKGTTAAPKEEGLLTKFERVLESTSPMAAGVAASIPGYEPKSIQGQALKRVFNIPEKVSKAAGGASAELATKHGFSPAIAGLVGAGAETATMAASMLAPGPKAAAVERAASTVASDLKGIIQKAHILGYKLKPSEAGGKIGTMIEGAANSSKIEVGAVVHNQTVTDNLALTAAKTAGLAPDARLSRPAIETAIKANGKPYAEVSRALGEFEASPQYLEDVAKVGRRPGTTFEAVTNPAVERLKEGYANTKWVAKDVVFEIRKLREAGGRNIRSPKPEEQELGHAQREFAEAMESELERKAAEIGRPELVADLRQARTNIAKLHDIKAVLRGNSVDAKRLAKIGERKPLTGELRDIADVAGEFPNVTRHANEVRQKVPLTAFESFGAGISAATSHPAAAAAFIARPIARKALLSDRYQRALAGKNTLESLEGAKDKTRRALTLAETEQQ